METPPRAVTYQDTYFLETSAASSESIHLHELVHTVQWLILGPEDFLLLYAAGLAEHGYKDSPLEAKAYAHQARFEARGSPYSVEAEIGAATLALLPHARNRRRFAATSLILTRERSSQSKRSAHVLGQGGDRC
jgi:hypothetical protein